MVKEESETKHSAFVTSQLNKIPRMNEKQAIFSQVESNQIDRETGEVVQEVIVTQKNIGAEPEYIKLYINDLLYLSKLPQGLNSALFALIKRMNYEGHIVLNSAVKKVICIEIEKTMASLDKALSGFVKQGVLIRLDKGVYLANPYLFGRGKWQDIKRIRMTIEYNTLGRYISKPDITEDEQQSSEENTD